jgi:amino acid permease
MEKGTEYMLGSPVKETNLNRLPVLTAMKDEGTRKKPKTLTAWGATFICSNACIGAGVLAFPNVFARGGFLCVFLLMIFVVGLELVTLNVLVKNSLHLGVTQFQTVVEKLYGSTVSVFFSILIASYMFGALVAYTIVIGDTLTQLAIRHIGKGSICSQHSFNISVIGLFILLPLSMKRTFKDLQWVSYLSMSSVLYIMIAVTIRSMQVFEENDWEISKDIRNFPTSFSNVMDAIPVISFAFVCHLQICDVASQLDPNASFFGKRKGSVSGSSNNNGDEIFHSLGATEATSLLGRRGNQAKISKTMNIVSIMAVLICAMGYGTIGVTAYLATPKKWFNISDLLLGYSIHDNLMEVARVALVLNIMSSFPINLGPCRSAIMDVLQKLFKHKLHDRALSAVVTTCIVVGAIMTGLAIKKLGIVFKIIGGTVGALLIFMLPGCMLITKKATKGQKFMGVFLNVFGVALFSCTVVSYFV